MSEPDDGFNGFNHYEGDEGGDGADASLGHDDMHGDELALNDNGGLGASTGPIRATQPPDTHRRLTHCHHLDTAATI